MARVFRLRSLFRIRPAGGMLKLRRSLLSQTLGRTLFVVDAAEPIESLLLRPPAAGRRTSRLLFQRPVHPLVTTVLLRVARLEGLQTDAQPQPAHRPPRQPRKQKK